MAAFAANTAGRDAKRQGGGEIIAYPMKASTTIYKGDIVVIDLTDGYATSLVADASMGTGDFFAGICQETKTSSAVAGVDYVNCYVTGSFIFTSEAAHDTLAATDLGLEAYANSSTDAKPHYVTLQAGTTTHDLKVGRVVDAAITTTSMRVRIDGYAGCMSVAT